jgi:hypothetical protein
VPRVELACGRVGDDVDGMVVQPDRPALRLLSGPAACMTTSWCICMVRGIVPHAFWWWCSRRLSWPTHQSGPGGGHERRRPVVRGRDFSCGAETSLARRSLLGGSLL